MRISTLSIFRNGVKPIWEDPANSKGGEYQLRLSFANDGQSMSKINTIWESMIMDLITNRFPHSE